LEHKAVFCRTGWFGLLCQPIFNVFINVKYQTGKHFSDIAPQSLDEVKISFGLGYMLWARKHWVRFRKPNDNSQ
jgi:hypothetical protein